MLYVRTTVRPREVGRVFLRKLHIYLTTRVRTRTRTSRVVAPGSGSSSPK